MVGVNRAVQKPKKTSDDVQVDEEDQEEEKVEDEIAARNEAEEDQFEAAMGIRNVDTWSAGGVKKDIVIRILVQCFASMVESTPREGSIPDFKGRFKPEDMEYHKLLDASRQVVKAKKALLKNEHYETRNFSIFIANKQWVNNILRPLLELSADDDSHLAINIAGLVLVLVRRMSDKALMLLSEQKKKSKAKSKSKKFLQSVAPTTTADENNKSIALSDSEVEDDEPKVTSSALQNAIDQLKALLSFKTGLCSEKANLAITNAFRDFWIKEQAESNPDTKLGVAICLSYFRRILAIGPHPVWCTPGEIFLHADIHHQYIVQLRALLSVIPGICSDLRRAYHDDWLVDIIHIIYYVLHIYDAKDMFLVYKSGGVIKEFHTLLEDDGVEDEKEPSRPPTATQPGSQSLDGDHKSTSSRSVHVPNNLKELYSQKTLTKGLLSDKLRSERQSRSQVASVQPRFGRFAATYRQPMVVSSQASSQDAPLASSAAGIVAFDAANPTATNPSNPADPASGEPTLPTGPPNTSSVSNDCVILRDVFGQRGDAVPQAKLKRNKRHMAFVQGNPYLSSIHTQGLSVFKQQATVIAASFLEVFSQEACFKTFVRRVNEDLRRDERRITQEVEVEYLAIVSKVLQYNRYKLQQDYEGHLQSAAARQQQQDGEAGEEGRVGAGATDVDAAGWQPSFKNIIDALDRMSFTRVVTMIEKLFTSTTKTPTAYSFHRLTNTGGSASAPQLVSIQLYTEMIAYLRMMLYSDNLTFHEISIGALHRLYYAAQGSKLDVLPKLWSTYKPQSYTKEHLHALITCTHETLKALDTAHNLFVLSSSSTSLQQMYVSLIDNINAIKKKKMSKREMDMEMYVYACYKFVPSDYLRKLATVSTSILYFKALQETAQNPMVLNYQIYKYLQRLYDYRIERHDNQSTSNQARLSFTFFNLTILSLIQNIFNTVAITSNPKYAAIIAFLKLIVRDFIHCAQRNHALFVEAILGNITSADHCVDIYTVYNAYESMVSHAQQPVVAPGAASKAGKGASEGAVVLSDSEEEEEAQEDASSSSDGNDDLGDEFDETAPRPAYAFEVPVAPVQKNRAKKRKQVERESDSEGGQPHSKTADAADDSNERRGSSKRRRVKWTAEEDAVLRQLYAIYKDARSVFSTIATHDDFSALGTNRSAQQVAHRVRALGLDRSGPSETPDGDRGGTASPEQDSPASDRESPVTSAPVQGEEGDWAVENMEDIFEQRAMRLQQMSQRMQASAVEDDGPIFSDDEEETQPQTAATSLPKAAGKTFGRGKLRGRGGGAAVDSLGERTNRDSDDEALEEEETAPAGNAGASSARMLLSDDEDA